VIAVNTRCSWKNFAAGNSIETERRIIFMKTRMLFWQAVLCVIGIFFLVCWNTPSAGGEVKLTLGSGPAGGSWYPFGAAIGEIVQKEIPGAIVAVQPSGGALANIVGVNSGQYDIGLAFSHASADAIKGAGEFKEKMLNIRGLASFNATIFQCAVRADSDIKEFKDLKGKRLGPGLVGGAGEATMKLVLSVHGLSYKDMAKVDHLAYADTGNLMKDRHLDAFSVLTYVPAPVIQDVAMIGGVRLLSLQPDKLQEIQKINPGFAKYVIPANSYKGQTQEVVTVATMTTVIVNSKLPEDLVYKIAKALVDNRGTLIKVHKSFEEFTLQSAPKNLGIPLHPGAEKYYKENKAL
jgi:TRAP transporter TAXI family solute receptor